MRDRSSSLPHVKIDIQRGLVTSIELDGEKLHSVKALRFESDVAGGYPVVTVELWATIELDGEIATVMKQDRHVQRCTRPHIGEDVQVPTQAVTTAVEATSDDLEVSPGASAWTSMTVSTVTHGYDKGQKS